MHGSSLSQLRARAMPEQAGALRGHIEEEHTRQGQLRAALGVSEEQAEHTRRQMWTWDGLSLALCLGWRPFTSKDAPTHEGPIDIELRAGDGSDRVSTLDPWPFAADRVTVCCEARKLESRHEDETQMQEALARATPETLTFELRPG